MADFHFPATARPSFVWNAVAAFMLLSWWGVAGAQSGEPAVPADTARAAKGPQVFGYVQVHYRYAFDTGADSLVDADDFRVQRVRIGVKGVLNPRVSYDLEFDPRAPEITSVLRDAYIELHVISRHRIRIGQQKTQFGYENRESSSRLFAVNRTEVSDNLARGVTLRDIGVGLIGNLKLGGGWRIEDAITVVNGAGMNVQADNTRRKNVWGRVSVRYRNDPADWLARVGFSGATGDAFDPGDDLVDPSDDFLIDFHRLGVDVELDHPWGFLSAEHVSSSERDPAIGAQDERAGYYLNLVGKTRYEMGPIVRFDVLDDEFKRWTLGAYYGLPDAPLRFLLNYEVRKIKDDVRGDDKLYLWTQVRF